MKLCLVTPYPPRYQGFGQYASALLRDLTCAEEVDELVVLVNNDVCPSDIPATGAKGLRILPTWDGDSPSLIAQTSRAIAGEKPDVVWFNSGLMLQNSLLANLARVSMPALTRSMGFPTVVTLHNLMQPATVRQLGFKSSRARLAAGHLATRIALMVDRVCVTLRSYERLLESEYGATNVDYVPHHVFHEPRDCFTPGNRLRLVSFGVMAPHKGVDVLLAAHADLAHRFPAELRIAGGPHPRFPGFQPRAAGPATMDVKFLGQLSEADAQRLMAWGDVVVLPNLATAGSSSVAHRAAALGKTIVASDLPDFRALSEEEGMAVQFFPPGDVSRLADILARLACDVELRADSAQRNLAAAAFLTPQRITRRYISVFEGLTQGAWEVTPSPAPRQVAKLL